MSAVMRIEQLGHPRRVNRPAKLVDEEKLAVAIPRRPAARRSSSWRRWWARRAATVALSTEIVPGIRGHIVLEELADVEAGEEVVHDRQRPDPNRIERGAVDVDEPARRAPP